MAKSEYARQRLLEISAAHAHELAEEERREREAAQPHREDPANRDRKGRFIAGNPVSATTPTKWQPGQSGNPRGKPRGSRNVLTKAFIKDLANAWRRYGPAALAQCAQEQPAAFLAVCSRVIPPDVLKAEEQPSKLVVEWAVTRRIIDPKEPEQPQALPSAPGAKPDWPPQPDKPMVTDLREAAPPGVEPMEQRPRPTRLPEPERPRRMPIDYGKGNGGVI